MTNIPVVAKGCNCAKKSEENLHEMVLDDRRQEVSDSADLLCISRSTALHGILTETAIHHFTSR